jgi:protein-disulfide isomerase
MRVALDSLDGGIPAGRRGLDAFAPPGNQGWASKAGQPGLGRMSGIASRDRREDVGGTAQEAIMKRRGLVALGAALLPGAAMAQTVSDSTLSDSLTPGQRTEVLQLLRRALREDPSILRDAMASLEQSEQAERNSAQVAAINARAEMLFRDASDPVKGNPQGRVTFVEFFDARCGYCKQLHPSMDQLLQREGDVRVVLKDLPILGPSSVVASRALLAAQKQNLYVPLYDALMRLREEPAEPVLRREAERVRIDWTRLRRDMDDPSIQVRIARNLELARALDIQGTPALIIGTTLVPGAVDLAELQRLTAAARG